MPKTVRHGKSEEYALSEEQLQSLWSQCQEIEAKVLVGLMAYCGLRVSEATHLQSTWIRNEEINIPSTMPCGCWECRGRGYWQPKSKAGVRSIPMPKFLQPTMMEYYRKRPEGLNITRQSAWDRIKRLAKQASLPMTFPHSLRATYATILASKGMEATTICYTLGWSRLEIAQSYIRIARARQKAKEQITAIWG